MVVNTFPNPPKSFGAVQFIIIGPIKIPMPIRNMTLGIFVRSNNALKICDRKIKHPNAIIAVDTDIKVCFSVRQRYKNKL